MVSNFQQVVITSVRKPRAVAKSILWEGQGHFVERLSLQLSNGDIQERIVTKHLPGAVIVAINSQSEIVLLKKYRLAVERTLVELPAGKIELTEAPLVGAQRELLEETGLTANRWTELGSAYGAQGSSDWICHYFCAEELTSSASTPYPQEEHSMFWLPMIDCWHWVLDGRIGNNFSVVGLVNAFVYLKLLTLKC